MHIIIVADAIAPYQHLADISDESAGLAVAFKREGHQVACIAPFSSDINVGAHSLARRLSPIKVDVDGEVRACVRYDGRTSDGVEVYLIDGGEPTGPAFCKAACDVIASLPSLPDACIAVGPGALRVIGTCRARASDEVAIPYIARISMEAVVSTVEASAADRVVFASRALAGGNAEAIIIPSPGARLPAVEDKPSKKTGFQMSRGLPVRDDVPLVLVSDLEEDALRKVLTLEIQVVAVDMASAAVSEIQKNYTDRLVTVGAAELPSALAAADAAVVGTDLVKAQTALASGALPVVDPTIASEVVSLEPSLETGSAIVAGPDGDALRAGLGQLAGAFKKREAFTALAARLPDFAVTGERAVAHYVQLIDEVMSDKINSELGEKKNEQG